MAKELEKKEIKYWNGSNMIPSIIVGYEYDIGITAINKNDSKDVLFCLHGPLSPSLPIKWGDGIYKHLFDKITEAIEDGTVRWYELDHWFNKYVYNNVGTKPTNEDCPFNQ